MEATVGVVEGISEHGGKSRGLELRNGGTNLRKRMNELAGAWEAGSSSKCPRAGEPRMRPGGAGGDGKSRRRRRRRRMPGKKPKQ